MRIVAFVVRVNGRGHPSCRASFRGKQALCSALPFGAESRIASRRDGVRKPTVAGRDQRKSGSVEQPDLTSVLGDHAHRLHLGDGPTDGLHRQPQVVRDVVPGQWQPERSGRRFA